MLRSRERYSIEQHFRFHNIVRGKIHKSVPLSPFLIPLLRIEPAKREGETRAATHYGRSLVIFVLKVQQRSNQSAAIVSYAMKRPTFPVV